MQFLYKEWDQFCMELSRMGYHSVTAASLLQMANQGSFLPSSFLNLKHDVESSPIKALELARIENKYGHCATYYVQAYLMTPKNRDVFTQIKALGHEVSYHHDVIDVANGDIAKAVEIYQDNILRFEQYGFEIITVCQHGSPVSKYDNRDFFRESIVAERFHNQADIMVNFMAKINIPYLYISDVGMKFKHVLDPLNKFGLPEEEKYKLIGNLDDVVKLICGKPGSSFIVSSHPHRYNYNRLNAVFKTFVFKSFRMIAKTICKIPGVKDYLFKLNFLTKKI